MKKIGLILIIIYLQYNLSSQNYIEYQKEITKAENLMFERKYPEAIRQFKQTFDAYEFNFPRDCMVAAQIASFMNDADNAFYFLRKAVRFGATIERIRMVTFLMSLQIHPQWNEFVKEYPEIRKAYYDGLNLPYRELCNQYYIRDQELRDRDQVWYRNLNRRLSPRSEKKWVLNCEKTLEVIDSLIPIYGFPSYKTIGGMDSTLPKRSNRSLSSCQILIVYYHYYSIRRDANPKYLEKLYDEVVKGNLSVRDYALILEFKRREEKGYKEDSSSLYYIRWEPKPDTTKIYANEAEVNQRREALGLSTCHYERLRKIWEHNYRFEFFYYEF